MIRSPHGKTREVGMREVRLEMVAPVAGVAKGLPALQESQMGGFTMTKPTADIVADLRYAAGVTDSTQVATVLEEAATALEAAEANLTALLEASDGQA